MKVNIGWRDHRVYIGDTWFNVSDSAEQTLEKYCTDGVVTISNTAPGKGVSCLTLVLAATIKTKYEGDEPACHYIMPFRIWEPSVTICPKALRLLFGRVPKRLYVLTHPEVDS